jgi:hypothetical protein
MSKQKSRHELRITALANRVIQIGNGAKGLAELLAARLAAPMVPREEPEYKTFTELALKDPIGLGYKMAEHKIRADRLSQRNGELRKENYRLRAKSSEDDKLIADLRAQRDELRKNNASLTQFVDAEALKKLKGSLTLNGGLDASTAYEEETISAGGA